MYKFISLCCSIVFLIGLAACSQDKPKEQAASTPETTQQQPAAAPASAPGTPVTGKVLETMDSGGYTYMNVETEAGPKWVAVNQTPVEVGEEVTFVDGMVMQNFTSTSLNRTFPEIVFSNGLVGKGATPPMPPADTGAESFSKALTSEGGTAADAAAKMVTGSEKAIVPFAEIHIEKAPGENSYTVAEIFSKAAELNGKDVVVRGKVMKVSPSIMGRNWIHIQDGTGNPAEKTHDLVITTTEKPDPEWDIVTLEGTLAANKDFGAGYTYQAIIENATLKD
jgi:hypothetical protein